MSDRKIQIEVARFARKEALDRDKILIRDIRDYLDKCDINNAASKYRDLRNSTYLDHKLGSITGTEFTAFRSQAEQLIANVSKRCKEELRIFYERPIAE